MQECAGLPVFLVHLLLDKGAEPAEIFVECAAIRKFIEKRSTWRVRIAIQSAHSNEVISGTRRGGWVRAQQRPERGVGAAPAAETPRPPGVVSAPAEEIGRGGGV